MGNVGIPELIFIFVLALLLFGPKKLPELGRTIGKALSEFRKASADFQATIQEEMHELERHARDVETKAHEVLNAAESAVGLPDGPIGSGSILPEHAAAPPAEPPDAAATSPAPSAPGSEDFAAGEKPADGDPKPA